MNKKPNRLSIKNMGLGNFEGCIHPYIPAVSGKVKWINMAEVVEAVCPYCQEIEMYRINVDLEKLPIKVLSLCKQEYYDIIIPVFYWYTCPTCNTKSGDMEPIGQNYKPTIDDIKNGPQLIYEQMCELLLCSCGKTHSWYSLKKNKKIL